MVGNHPDRESLTRYVRGELVHARKQRIRKHVSSCFVCQRRETKLSAEAEKELTFVDYEHAIKNAAEKTFTLLKSLDDEERGAAQLLSGLVESGPSEYLDRIGREPQFQSLKLFQLLQQRCRSAWVEQSTARAIEFAQMGVAVASHLSESRYGSGLVADARALAWAYLGNLHRIACDRMKAEQALRIALEYQELSGDPLTKNEILLFLASLRRSQECFDECDALYEQVIEICREGEDRQGEGRALISKGTALADRTLGEINGRREAIRLLRKGLARIDPSADPDLTLAARHNILYCLAESGGAHEAHQMLKKERHLYLGTGESVHLAKLPWLEGIIAEGLDRLSESQALLWKSREILDEGQRSLDAAFVSLRLGFVLSRQGRRREAKRLVEEIIPIFESLNVSRPASAARLLFLRLR
jgi:tetratricopeptide (TPR) repeat protein